MIKDLSQTIFNLSANWISIAVICACLILLTGLWINYCSYVVAKLKNHINAVTLRKLEKLFREGGDIEKLVEILASSRNDIAMIFYVFCRADMGHNKISEHLTYNSFKHINNKIKPYFYEIFYIVSCFLFFAATLAVGLNFNRIDWNSPVMEITFFAAFFIQIITVSTIYFLTRHKIGAYWQEFKNLFSSMQRHSYEYWAAHGHEYPAFSKKLVDVIQVSGRVNHRVEQLISKCIRTGSFVDFKISKEDREAGRKPEKINEVPRPQSNGQNNETAKTNENMMDRMMNIMQQNLQHNQFMNQQMQQAQVMQYSQILQPSLQQHTMQNQIMMQNAQIQNMINQRFAIAATAMPTPPRPPMPPYEPRPAVSLQRSPFIKPAELPANEEVTPTADIKAEGSESEKTEVNNSTVPAEQVPGDAAAVQPADVSSPEGTPEEKPKNPGKEVSQKPFEILNKQFKAKNKDLYADKRFQAPVVFLRPDREASKLEERLEAVFHAKVIKYMPGEWEQLKPTE